MYLKYKYTDNGLYLNPQNFSSPLMCIFKLSNFRNVYFFELYIFHNIYNTSQKYILELPNNNHLKMGLVCKLRSLHMQYCKLRSRFEVTFSVKKIMCMILKLYVKKCRKHINRNPFPIFKSTALTYFFMVNIDFSWVQSYFEHRVQSLYFKQHFLIFLELIIDKIVTIRSGHF